MRIYSLKISSCGASILVVSSNQRDLKKLETSEFLQHYIPEAKIKKSAVRVDAVLMLKRGENKLVLEYPKMEYRSKSYVDNDIVSLAEYLLERARQDRGYYCIHGAATEVSGKAIIFWGGASGMGKTTLAKYFRDSAKGVWFADEKVVIDLKRRIVVGGLSSAYYNKGAQIIHEKLMPRSKSVLPIAMFVYPFVTAGHGKLRWVRWSKEKFDWHLFEELNRKIRGTSRRIFNNQEPVMSLDDLPLALRRNRLISEIVKKKPCFYAQGSARDIITEIEKNLPKKIG